MAHQWGSLRGSHEPLFCTGIARVVVVVVMIGVAAFVVVVVVDVVVIVVVVVVVVVAPVVVLDGLYTVVWRRFVVVVEIVDTQI
jgi:hypothetical protein